MIWLSIDLRFKWFGCQSMHASTDVGCPSKMTFWSSKTKLLRETSFKNEALKLKNEAFLRNFLQKWSFDAFEAQKRSFSAKLPSKMKLWSSKTKLFCETSFKNEALKLKNEAFLWDLVQKCHVDPTLDLRITICFSDFWVNASKVLRLPRKSWAEAYEALKLPREMIPAK